jgi:hypothetical protein
MERSAPTPDDQLSDAVTDRLNQVYSDIKADVDPVLFRAQLISLEKES